jgi:hypothetical protein
MALPLAQDGVQVFRALGLPHGVDARQQLNARGNGGGARGLHRRGASLLLAPGRHGILQVDDGEVRARGERGGQALEDQPADEEHGAAALHGAAHAGCCAFSRLS